MEVFRSLCDIFGLSIIVCFDFRNWFIVANASNTGNVCEIL